MNLRIVCSLENRRTCYKIWVWEQRFFCEELEKKGHLMDFYCPSSIVVLTELTFFDKISAWEYWEFMKNQRVICLSETSETPHDTRDQRESLRGRAPRSYSGQVSPRKKYVHIDAFFLYALSSRIVFDLFYKHVRR